jgi:hypothetical protein
VTPYVVAVALTLIVALGLDEAQGVPIPGGGPAASDCLVTFDARTAPLTTHGSRSTIECVECDPACDADVGVNDGRCVLRLGVCVGQATSEACEPAVPLSRVTIVGATPVESVLDGTTAVCLDYEATATLRRRGSRQLAGTRKVRLKAVGEGRPRRTDKDTIRFRCLPREGECPGTVTTSVTSSTVTSTTEASFCGSTGSTCAGRCPSRGQRCLNQAGVCTCVTLRF